MLLTLALFAAAQEAAPPPQFVEVGELACPGIATTCGSPEKDYIIEVNGGGLALGDFDGDGAWDLVVVDGSTLERVEAGKPGLPPRLLLGDGAGAFAPAHRPGEPATGEAWRLEAARWGTGAAVGDVNGDGHPDLYVTEWGPNRLWINGGGSGFAPQEGSCEGAPREWSTSAAFADLDRDGQLDLAVINYLDFDPERIDSRRDATCRWKGHAVTCGPEGLTPQHDRLWRGRGDGGFEEVTETWGFRPESPGFGLGLMTLDYDLDGDTDLYVTNDSTPNHLWQNQGDGALLEQGLWLGAATDGAGKEQAGMGVAAGDLDGDGHPDLFVTNFSGEANTLYAGSQRGSFRDRSHSARLGGPSIPLLGWGTGSGDLDLDGDLDLFVLNGHVYPQADLPGTDTSFAQPDLLFRNDAAQGGRGRFAPEPLSDAGATRGRAGALADLDGDGDLDLVAIELGGQLRILHNLARGGRGAGGHWLRIRLRGKQSNRDGLGALVTARFEGGELTAEMRTAGGFQAAVPAEVHFGLGAVSELEALEVRWPSGRVQRIEGVACDRVLTLEEPEP